MRIDLSSQTAQTNGLEANPKAAARPAASPAQDQPTSDQAELSADQGRVQALVAQVIALPEIRQEKVSALAGMVQRGQYPATAEHSANALLSHLEAASAA
jgi:flagellar biosynthesis anti-sigma factor FlgM